MEGITARIGQEPWALCVGNLPGRKKPMLYWYSGIEVETCASFRNEAEAKRFAAWLERIHPATGGTDDGAR